MLLLEEFPFASTADSPVPLLSLGLTQREADMLYWIAQGKTSPEIAVILGSALLARSVSIADVPLRSRPASGTAKNLRGGSINSCVQDH